MLKKFLEGLVFGGGLAISFVVVWAIGMYFVLPSQMTSYATHTKEPKFKNPSEAVLKEPESKIETEQKEFTFFKESSSRMAIPTGGGILAMSPITTAKGSKRPSSYQLWLTESKLWQIRTTEEKVEIEELPYPKGGSVKDLDDIMFENLGVGSRQSAMTVSPEEISRMKSTGSSWRDESLNGSLKISVEGVVFVLPNPYET
ncbi:MAG: hypothetical protein WB812_06180 [Woeseiaceae bacterium]